MAKGHQYRTAGLEPRLVRVLDFDKLPPAVKERLSRCLADGAAPAPLFAEPSALPARIPGTPRLYRGIGVFAGLLELGLWFAHFGDLESRYSIQPLWFLSLHTLAAFLFFVSFYVFRAFAASKSVGAPYPGGRYLFALDMVEADGRILKLTSLDSLRAAEVRERNGKIWLDLSFRDGETTSFRASGEDALATATHAQREIDEALRLVLPDDQPKLERADPFFELRIAEDWSSAEVLEEKGQGIPSFRRLLGRSLLAASFLGPLLLLARNWASDESMFGQTREKAESGEEQAFETAVHHYQDYGWRHKGQVDELGFERAKRQIASLARFLRRYPNSQYAERADEALFEKAKAERTIAAFGLYLEAGGKKHREEADDALFAEVKRQGTAFALRQYLDFKGERHTKEIEEELLPEKRIAEAMKTRSVLTLLEIAKEKEKTPWEEAAKVAVHRIYKDLTASYGGSYYPNELAAGTMLTTLLSHAERVMDPHVRLLVQVTVPDGFVHEDGELARKYGAKYHPTWPVVNVNELRGARGEIEEHVTKQIRELVGEALVLMPGGSGEQGVNRKESKDWSTIRVEVSPAMGTMPFFTKTEDEVFADVRLFVRIVTTLPGGEYGPTLTLTSLRAAFNADVHGVIGRLLGNTKPGDEYKEMLKGAPASIGESLAGAFRGRRF